MQNKACFTGWRYLWTLNISGSHLNADLDFLCDMATVYNQYIQNTKVPVAESALYHQSFVKFMQEADNKEQAIKALLTPPNAKRIPLIDFKAFVETAIAEKTLVPFFAENGNPIGLWDQQLSIIGKDAPHLKTELKRAEPLILPKPLWEALKKGVATDYIKTNTLVSKVREKLSEDINYKIGTGEGIIDAKGNKLGLDIKKMIEITNPDKEKGLILSSGSRGSVFEHWVRMRFDKLFAPKNEGKQTFYFEVANKETDAETRTPIDKTAFEQLKLKREQIKTTLADGKTLASLKEQLEKDLVALPEPKTRLIDCSYADGGALNSEQGKDCNLVGVEVKHISDKLDGEPLKQLKDNVELVKGLRMKRIEYIFSKEKIAKDNKALFSNFNNANPGGIKLFYIDDNGAKQPMNL